MVHVRLTLSLAVPRMGGLPIIWRADMAVPKRKHSNSRSGKRRSHDGLKARQLTSCPRCSNTIPPHTVCPTCGYYMGRVVVEPKDE